MAVVVSLLSRLEEGPWGPWSIARRLWSFLVFQFHVNFRLMITILDFPLSITYYNNGTSPIALLDLENMGVAVAICRAYRAYNMNFGLPHSVPALVHNAF